MALKLWLSFLMLYVIHDVQTSDSRWEAKVPSTIPVVHGSCVVIPCSYSYPKLSRIKNQLLKRRIGHWMKGREIISSSLSSFKPGPAYRKRTKFLGNLNMRNCTMMLDSVRTTDVGPFYFRIQMPTYKSFSYKNNTVSLQIISYPDPPALSVEVNAKVKAYCSITHSCPVMPPRLSWSRTGTITVRSKKLNQWKWETMSTLTFQPQPTDFNKYLNCTVQYKQRMKASNSIMLQEIA